MRARVWGLPNALKNRSCDLAGRMLGSRWSGLAGALVISMVCWGRPVAHAETISGALARAYSENPDLNRQRAHTRVTDENVSTAKSGYRPQVSGTGSLGFNYADESIFGATYRGTSFPTSAGLTVTQTLFNGNRTANSVRRAESQVLQSREQIRTTEQNTLLRGATAYMNVLRDTAIQDLNRFNIIVLEEQLRQTRERYSVGEVTFTDIAQTTSSLARARSNFATSGSNIANSFANYREIIGDQPRHLEPARPVDALLPRTVQEAVALSMREHPLIQAALHDVDAASLQVQVNEGQLYPTLNVAGNVQNNNQYEGVPQNRLFNGSVLAQLSFPIYSGGETYAAVRQAKEAQAEARLEVDVQRDSVRANVESSWAVLQATKTVVLSSRAEVQASELALRGVRDEARVGQRTTLDVLNAQQALLMARINLVSAQRDRVVASYNVLAAIGRLTATNLNLGVVVYDPTIHLDQVKDKWGGLRTPEGR